MSIVLKLEEKIVHDIIHVLKRLPFHPHFLIELEAQFEAQRTPDLVAAPAVAAPVAPVVADPAPAAAAPVDTAPAVSAPMADAAPVATPAAS
jgi:hypothetical protein